MLLKNIRQQDKEKGNGLPDCPWVLQVIRGRIMKLFIKTLILLLFCLTLNAQTIVPELSILKQGNARFVRSKGTQSSTSQKDRDNLLNGQKPKSIILSCSDSRISPEIIFDQKLGEMFVVRTAGEALDSVSIASIEYAVEHLGTKLLVVLGHEDCGAIKAAVKSLDGKSLGSKNLDKLAGDIRPRIKKIMKGKTSASPMYADEAIENAKGIVKELKDRSKIIKEKEEKGELNIVYGIYHLKSGVVNFL